MITNILYYSYIQNTGSQVIKLLRKNSICCDPHLAAVLLQLPAEFKAEWRSLRLPVALWFLVGAVSLCNFDEEATSSSCCCWFFLGLLLLCIKDNSEACLYFFLGGSLIACLCATYLAAQIIAPTVDRIIRSDLK